MKINPHIFRAYDIRGVYGQDLTEEVFQKIGFVLGRAKENFVIGNDVRGSGKSLASALISGLLKSGSKAIYVGTGSFGQIFFSGSKLKADKTLFITASHLPPEWNGLKPCFGDGEPLSKEDIEKIRDKVIEIEEKEIDFPQPKIEEISLKQEYFNSLLEKFPLLKNNKKKIVLDCGNGSMSFVAPELFKKLGFKSIELFCQPDPSFPNRSSEPSFEALKVLREKTVKEKAEFGLAFDGDGDRIAMVDDKGRYLAGNQLGIILGKDILPGSESKKVVRTVSCSMAIDQELKQEGAEIIEVPVGHTYVVSACKREKACLGMEESGHIVIPQYFLFDDAIIPALKIAEILLRQNKKLSELAGQIKIYPFEEIVFDCSDEIKFNVVEGLTEEFKNNYQKVNTLDGVKVSFDRSWILIRVSNTSPKIRLYLEAETKEELNSLKEEFSQILKNKISRP